MSIIKTTDYKMFKFKDDNRAKIKQGHVENLKRSILSKNLLEFRPIVVNQNFEIFDGQHRLLAAQDLGVPIYYQIQSDLRDEDIILYQVAAAWSYEDFLNYYVKHRNENYIRLNEFMKKNQLSLKVCMSIFLSGKKDCYTDFKEGRFEYLEEDHAHDVEVCHQTIDIITRFNGPQAFTKTTKFWKALIILVKHESFSSEQWFTNVPKMVSNFTVKANQEEYLSGFLYIHNYKSKKQRIDFTNDQSIEF